MYVLIGVVLLALVYSQLREPFVDASSNLGAKTSWDASSNLMDAKTSWDASSNLMDASSNLDPGSVTQPLSELIDLLNQSQKMEDNLYNTLRKNATNVANGQEAVLTQSEKDDIVAQINQFSVYRTSLYAMIATNYKSQVVAENAATSTTSQQLATLKLLEKEMNKSKKALAGLKEERLNAMKMVEINTYYSKQYSAYLRVMQVLTVGCVLLIGASFLGRAYPTAGYYLNVAILVVGVFVVGYLVLNISMRTDTNYDEFIWPMAPTSAATLSTANDNTLIDISGAGFDSTVCAGAYCCGEGTVWSDSVGCVVADS